MKAEDWQFGLYYVTSEGEGEATCLTLDRVRSDGLASIGRRELALLSTLMEIAERTLGEAEALLQ